MDTKYLRDLEQRRKELEERIEQQQVELDHLNAIMRQHFVVMAVEGHGIPVTRKNRRFLEITGYVRRFLNECFLEDKDAGLRAREIYDLFVQDHIDLKYSTLRSYLHRLKNEEMIYQDRHGGPWHLVEHKEQPH